MSNRFVQRRKPGAWLRVAGAALAMFALSLGWLLQRARAELSERALTLGTSLAQLSPEHAGTTRVRVNGELLALNSRSTQLTVEQVLDRFSDVCARDSGGAQAELTQHAASRPKLSEWLDWRRMGVFRAEAERPGEQGVAGCFASQSDTGLRGVFTRLEAALDSGDLSRLGQFRYVLARKTVSGATHVLSVWAEGELRLERMFPAEGDVPGRDIVDGVRPPAATRVLSAEADENGFRSALYESERGADEALLSYDEALRSRGYVALGSEALDESPVPTRVYTLNDRDLIVVIGLSDGDRSMVSALHIASNGRVDLPL